MIYTLRQIFLVSLIGISLTAGSTAFAIMIEPREDPLDPPELIFPNCIIPPGDSVCTAKPSTVTNPVSGQVYDLYNLTTNVTTPNAYIPAAGRTYSYNLSYNPSYTGTAAELKYGDNILYLRKAGSRLNTSTWIASASCATGSIWTDGKCVTPTVCVTGSLWNGTSCVVEATPP